MGISLEQRKCASVLPLSDKEKVYLLGQLGFDSKYTIGEQLGRSGAQTTAFKLKEDSTDKDLVLRIPNNPDNMERWLLSEKGLDDKQDKYLSDYRGNICVPRTVKFGTVYSIQEMATGNVFNSDIYDRLPRKTQLKIAKEFAEFLNHSHRHTIKDGIVIPVVLDKGHDFKLNEQVKNAYKSVLNSNEYKWFESLLNDFETRDTADEISVFAFNDFRHSNVLYDESKERLSVIDFGCAQENSIYMDFVPHAADAFGMSYQFLKDVIDSYNDLDTKIQINPKKVALFHLLGIMSELADCNRDAEKLKQVIYMPHRLKKMYKLCSLFGIDYKLPNLELYNMMSAKEK